MTRLLLTLLPLSLLLQSGCIYSYYEYSLDSESSDVFNNPDPRKFTSGQITVEYERWGVFPRNEGFIIVDECFGWLNFITLPIAMCVEFPWHWESKKKVCYAIRHPQEVDGLASIFFKYPHTRLEEGEWRIVSELRWNNSQGLLTRIVLADILDAGANRYRSRLCVCEASGRRDFDIPIVGMHVEGMTTFDGNTIYLFEYLDNADYFDHFWRTDGCGECTVLVKFDMKSGEFTKMIWFDGGTIHVSDDVILDKSTLKTCSGMFGCVFDEDEKKE